MPPISEKQRRAMHAAASGSSYIGVPKSVGKEFSEADPGGKLPESKKDASMSPSSKLDEAVAKMDGIYPGPGRFRSFTGDPEHLVRKAEYRTTKDSALGGSPQAAIDLREAHLSRRAELIRELGYPSMKLLSGEKL